MKKIICETGSGMKKYIIGWRACQLRHPKMKWGWKVAKIILILLVVKLFIGMIVGLVVMVRMDKLVEKPPQKTAQVIMPAVNVPDIESFVLVSGATITAYNSEVGQTDSDPFTMASGKRVYDGAMACPSKYPFGTKVEWKGKVYTCDDRMNIKYRDKNRFDIWFESHQDAVEFGTKYNQTLKIIL